MSNLLDAMLGGQTLEQRLTEEGRALKKIGKTKEQDMEHSKEELLAAIVKFRKGNLITQARIDSDQFWENADLADIDEIDLEETLAKLELFAIADEAIKEGAYDGHQRNHQAFPAA